MRLSSLLLIVVALAMAVSLVCIWFYPSIQDFMESNMMWNGLRKFSSEFGAVNIPSLEELPESPEEAVLVTIPNLPYGDEELSKLRRFVTDGGTLLLLDDYGYGNSLLAYFGIGVRFTSKPLLDPLFCYKNQYMPRITDFKPGVKESGIDVIVLNHATSLTGVAEEQAMAWSSTTSFLDTNESGTWEEDEPKGPLVIAAELRLGQGTLRLVSDSSIVINTMFARDKNKQFVEYLTRRQDETKSILVDNSRLVKAPLDTSKEKVMRARETLSNPYTLLGIIAAIFAVVFRFTLTKGETIARH